MREFLIISATVVVLFCVALIGFGWVAPPVNAGPDTPPQVLFWNMIGNLQVMEISNGCLIFRESGKHQIPSMVFVPNCRVETSDGHLTVVADE